mgnify:FL=1
MYPELSYAILGILFDVWNTIGSGHKEIIYQRATAHHFRTKGLEIIEQAPAEIVYQGKIVGKYYFDFLINNQIVVELKVRNYFSKKDIEQVYGYLKSKNLKLGILAHFTDSGVKYKRVINSI